MNGLNKTLEGLALELQAMLDNQLYNEYGSLKAVSKNLFQYAFEIGILLMNKEIVGESYEETFTIVQSKFTFPLHLIGLDYQENQFTNNH